MEKLKLDLDDLQVESFEAEPEAQTESVLGYYGTMPKESTAPDILCQWDPTACGKICSIDVCEP